MGRKRIRPERTLASVLPDLAAELVDPRVGHEYYPGSSQRVTWLCRGGRDGHPVFTWDAAIKSRARLGTGCPVCACRAVLAGWNDVATTHPDIAAQMVREGLASQLSAFSNVVVVFVCDNGHPAFGWSAVLASRTRGAGCPACSGHAVIPGWNDVATTHPQIASQMADSDLATRISAGSAQVVEFVCSGASSGHPWFTWSAPMHTRARAGNGCPACCNRAVIPGWNDVATTHPRVASEMVDRPLAARLTAGSRRMTEFVCVGDNATGSRHRWTATVNSRTSGTGCPVCSPNTFNPFTEAWCYLVRGSVAAAQHRHVIQYGKTTALGRRLGVHKRTGFSDVLATAHFQTGAAASEFEVGLGRLVQASGVPTCHSAGVYFDGCSEAFFSRRDRDGALLAALLAEFGKHTV